MDLDIERLGGLCVLIVEDNFLLATELSDMLAELGCATVSAGRVDEGVKLARTHPLSGALLDVNLSNGETSFSIATILDSLGVPFVFLTGYDLDSSFPPRFRSAPRLSKPLDPNALVHAMLQHFAPVAGRID